MKTFAIIIPTYQRFDTLRKSLLFWQNQQFPKNEYEIIIIFDGKQKLTTREQNFFQFLEKRKFQIKIFLSPLRKGQGFARNIGITKANSKYFLFLDDDILPGKKLLKNHLLFLENNPQIASLGIVKTIYPKTKSSDNVYTFLAENSLSQLFTPSLSKISPQETYSGNLALPSLKNIFFPATTHQKYGFEDVIFASFLENSGFSILKNNLAIAYHQKKHTAHSLQQRSIHLGKNFPLTSKIKLKIPSPHYSKIRNYFKTPLRKAIYYRKYKDYFFSISVKIEEDLN